jgi:Gpi18-like mannosyltransferase
VGGQVESRIFIAALAFRIVSAFVAYGANTVLPQYQDQGFSVFPRQDHPFWDAFARFDAGWYHGIASQGYEYRGVGRNNLAFFPVYPLLMRAGGWLLGGRQQDYYFAGIVISWLAFAAAMTVLYRLALVDLPRAAALRAVAYTAIFPFAYFFGAVYSESAYLLALLVTVYALRRQRWIAAAAAGAVMTATRATGFMAAPGLAWLAWKSAGHERSTQVKAALAAAACVGGIAAYSVFNAWLSPSPFTWYDAITFWNYHPGGNPFGSLLGLLRALVTRPYQFLTTERMAPYDTLNASAALLALGLVPLIWKRFNGGYALIVLAALVLPLSSGQFEGLGRYTSVQFPVFLALASFTSPRVHAVLFTVFAVLYVICQSLFATVHPLF